MIALTDAAMGQPSTLLLVFLVVAYCCGGALLFAAFLFVMAKLEAQVRAKLEVSGPETAVAQELRAARDLEYSAPRAYVDERRPMEARR